MRPKSPVAQVACWRVLMVIRSGPPAGAAPLADAGWVAGWMLMGLLLDVKAMSRPGKHIVRGRARLGHGSRGGPVDGGRNVGKTCLLVRNLAAVLPGVRVELPDVRWLPGLADYARER